MALQKVFREAYVEVLRSNIDPAKYAGESFDYEESQVHYMANVHQPENLLERICSVICRRGFLQSLTVQQMRSISVTTGSEAQKAPSGPLLQVSGGRSIVQSMSLERTNTS